MLSRWVAEPGSGVLFESEGALKILFAENGTKEQLLATINSMRAHALAVLERRTRVFDEVVRDGPPYPDRIHQSVLVFDLVNRLTHAVVEWADTAEHASTTGRHSRLIGARAPTPCDSIANLRDLALEVLASHPPAADDASESRGPAQPRRVAAM